MTPYLDSSIPICLFTIHFHGATMTINGSLQMSIPIVKAF